MAIFQIYDRGGHIQITNPIRTTFYKPFKLSLLENSISLVGSGLNESENSILIKFSVFDSVNIGNVTYSTIEDLYTALQNISSVFDVNGGLDVKIQDQTTEIIDLHFTKLIAVITVNTNVAIDDKTISINSVTLPVVGNMLCLKEGEAFYQGEIVAVVNNGSGNYTLTVDSPFDYAYTTASGCNISTSNLNVDGSVTPQVFSVTPVGLQSGIKWDITRILFQMLDGDAMDDGKFGGIAALTNGIVVRKKNATYKNIFNIKSNSDFALHAFDITYSDKAAAGTYGFRVRRTFAGQDKNGVVIRLLESDNDELQIIIQDNLTGLTKFEVAAQGHVVED